MTIDSPFTSKECALVMVVQASFVLRLHGRLTVKSVIAVRTPVSRSLLAGVFFGFGSYSTSKTAVLAIDKVA